MERTQARQSRACRGCLRERWQRGSQTTGRMLAVASLDDADLRLKMSASESEQHILEAQRRLLALRLQLGGLLAGGQLGPPLCVVFEGWDAAGQGRVRSGGSVGPFDPRHVRVTSSSPPPSPDERRHHFLQRSRRCCRAGAGWPCFDRQLVRAGAGRARRGLHRPTRRAARSIRRSSAFERGLDRGGTVLVKLWLQDLRARAAAPVPGARGDPLKRWKLTDEDWRNRRASRRLRGGGRGDARRRPTTLRRRGTSSPPSPSSTRASRCLRS